MKIFSLAHEARPTTRRNAEDSAQKGAAEEAEADLVEQGHNWRAGRLGQRRSVTQRQRSSAKTGGESTGAKEMQKR